MVIFVPSYYDISQIYDRISFSVRCMHLHICTISIYELGLCIVHTKGRDFEPIFYLVSIINNTNSITYKMLQRNKTQNTVMKNTTMENKFKKKMMNL